MNSSQVEKYLESPHLINSEDIFLLKKSVTDFPYVGIFQMLYVRGLQNIKSVYYGEALQRAALVVNDRNELYEILHRSAPETIITKADAPAFKNVEEKKETVTKAENLTIKASLNTEDIAEDKNSKTNKENLLEAVEDGADEAKISTNEKRKEVDSELVALESDILVEAINRSIQLDVSDIAKEETATEDSLTKNEKEPEAAKLENQKSIAAPSKFSDWLQVLDSGEVQESKAEPKIKKETQSALKSPEDLINQFISLKTTRLKNPKEYKNTKNISVKKELEKKPYVTETLANIYASQGNYLKAIKIYEQLTLTIPEKNTFFASRIRFLREKMEYDN